MVASENGFNERRRSVRLAGGSEVGAVVLDHHQQPIAMLEDARVLNVCADGVALVSHTPAQQGDLVRMTVNGARDGSDSNVVVRTLGCENYIGGRYRLRCERVAGDMPARLIYGW